VWYCTGDTKCGLLFNDHLAVVSSTSSCRIGDFTVATSAVRHHEHGNCLLVHASSHGVIAGVPCGTVITAYVAYQRLETLEHHQHEFAMVGIVNFLASRLGAL
jgi:hypothetical protein